MKAVWAEQRGMWKRIQEAIRWRADVAADRFRPAVRREKLLARILASPKPRDTRRAEADAAKLQRRDFPRSAYEYDPDSIWKRATERAEALVLAAELSAPGKRIL